MARTTTKGVTQTTKRKTVTVELNTFTLVGTQDTTVTKAGKAKTSVVTGTRFALVNRDGDLVATTNKRNLTVTKFNKKTVKELAPTVLPVVRKMVKTGELTL